MLSSKPFGYWLLRTIGLTPHLMKNPLSNAECGADTPQDTTLLELRFFF